jgi:hypothetical protein
LRNSFRTSSCINVNHQISFPFQSSENRCHDGLAQNSECQLLADPGRS